MNELTAYTLSLTNSSFRHPWFLPDVPFLVQDPKFHLAVTTLGCNSLLDFPCFPDLGSFEVRRSDTQQDGPVS